MNITEINEIGIDDYVMILKDGCYAKVRFGDIVFGNRSVCEAFLNCVEGIGCIDNDAPVVDTPPTMEDLIFNIPNRKSATKITMQDFINAYYDNENNLLDRVEIAGGDTNGYTLNGNLVNIGDVIKGTDILEYNAKNQDVAYQGVLFFKAYDENNIEAV